MDTTQILQDYLKGIRDLDLISLLAQDNAYWATIDDPMIKGVLAFIIGVCVGSFLNVMAHRSLEEKSWFFPPSSCPKCDKRLGIFDLIPIISFFLLNGNCRHCREEISWHYPVVEAATGCLFLATTFLMGWTLNSLAMLIFISTLMAVTVTDFKEKLIPHEITYPSMLAGLLFSWLVWADLPGTLAGVGASYILFDYIDFYGLILLKRIRGSEAEEETESDDEGGDPDPMLDRNFELARSENTDGDEEEEIVMGGGDAVLSAVISAWLGWQKMVMAIFIAFLVGAVMGACYLLVDLHRRKELSRSLKPGLIGFVIGFAGLYIPMAYIASMISSPTDPTQNILIMGAVGGVAGALCGMIFGGSRFESRFPFGPAIAIGGIIAVFTNFPGGERNLVPKDRLGHNYPVGHSLKVAERSKDKKAGSTSIVRIPQKEGAYSRAGR